MPWYTKEDRPKGLFARQAIPMVWDFAEVNPFASIGGTFEASVKIISGIWVAAMPQEPSLRHHSSMHLRGPRMVADLSSPPTHRTTTISATPTCRTSFTSGCVVHYGQVFPQLLSTIAVPKAEELVATPYRHGGKEKAEKFFLDGMTQAMHRLAEQAHPAAPITIYYAFKQSETEKEGTSSSWLGNISRSGTIVRAWRSLARGRCEPNEKHGRWD